MTWTKRAIVEEAYSELALAGYDFDLSADEMQTGLRRLDLMMAQLAGPGSGLRLSYNQGAGPTSGDLDDESGIPLYAVRAIVCQLAIELAAGFGKQVHPSTHAAARDGMQKILTAAAFPQEQQLPNTLPVGAGNKPWRTTGRPFMPTPDTAPLQVADDEGLQFGK